MSTSRVQASGWTAPHQPIAPQQQYMGSRGSLPQQINAIAAPVLADTAVFPPSPPKTGAPVSPMLCTAPQGGIQIAQASTAKPSATRPPLPSAQQVQQFQMINERILKGEKRDASSIAPWTEDVFLFAEGSGVSRCAVAIGQNVSDSIESIRRTNAVIDVLNQYIVIPQRQGTSMAVIFQTTLRDGIAIAAREHLSMDMRNRAINVARCFFNQSVVNPLIKTLKETTGLKDGEAAKACMAPNTSIMEAIGRLAWKRAFDVKNAAFEQVRRAKGNWANIQDLTYEYFHADDYRDGDRAIEMSGMIYDSKETKERLADVFRFHEIVTICNDVCGGGVDINRTVNIIKQKMITYDINPQGDFLKSLFVKIRMTKNILASKFAPEMARLRTIPLPEELKKQGAADWLSALAIAIGKEITAGDLNHKSHGYGRY